MREPLAPCRRWRNCVCSRRDASRVHRVEPFVILGNPEAVIRRLRSLLEDLPRTEIVTETADYLHALCRSLRGFIDDVEFRLCPDEGVIHVRSAARSGLHDLGVNRRRVERLRRRYMGE